MRISDWSSDVCSSDLKVLLPEIVNFANNPEPIGVVHPSNPSARNGIPRACAVLAHYLAGFDYFDVDDLDTFDVDAYVRRSEEHTSELQSLMRISYAVFCLKKNKKIIYIMYQPPNRVLIVSII